MGIRRHPFAAQGAEGREGAEVSELAGDGTSRAERRFELAKAALGGYCSQFSLDAFNGQYPEDSKEAARNIVAAADAMLAALEAPAKDKGEAPPW